MLDTQLGRRNLTPIQKISIAEKYRPLYEKRAKENQLSGLKQNQNTVPQKSAERQIQTKSRDNPTLTKSSNLDQPINTRKELAKTAGVSEDTYSKAIKDKELNK